MKWLGATINSVNASNRRQKLDLTAHTWQFQSTQCSKYSTYNSMSLPSTQVQQLQPKEFFASSFLENALVTLHFHPPFSIAKKHSILYGKQSISWISMYGQMKLPVATCTPGTSNAFCKSVCRQCRKNTFWTLLYATMSDWGHLPWYPTIARSGSADTLHLITLHPIFF